MAKAIKILCIEDNPGEARLIREMFNDTASLNYQPYFAMNIAQVKTVANDTVFDAILLDLNLSDSSGLDTLKQVQTLFPDTPIIVLTSLNDEITAEKSMLIGAQDYLVKNKMNSDLLIHSLKHAIDRHSFSKKLAETQLQFQTLIENVSDGIIVVDKGGLIKYVNPTTEILFSRKAGELINQSFGFPLSIDQGTEIDLIGYGDINKTVEMHVSEVVWDESPCYLSSLRDISTRKELDAKNLEHSDKLKALNDEKDKFFSIIAHDLRNPLNSFLGLTELMVEDFAEMEPENLKEMVVSMQKSAANLFRLIENLLEWSKMQRGLTPFKPKVVKIKSIVNDCIEMVSESIKNKNIELLIDISDDIKATADENMLNTIVRNFVSNATKFTTRGGKIFITTKNSGSEHIELSIRDTGIGMSPDMIGNLFHLNNQLNRKGTDGEPSTGLGLLLCKEFVEKLGGQIRVESEEGVGTVFCFTLPRPALEEQEHAPLIDLFNPQ